MNRNSDSSPIPQKKGLLFDVFKLMSGSTFAQALSLIVAPILTRLYAPEAFGLLALFVSFSAFPSIIACMRYEVAIPLPKKNAEGVALLWVAFFWTVVISMVTGIVIYALRYRIVSYLNTPEFLEILGWIPLAVFLAGLTISLTYWNTRLRNFGLISIANFIGAFLIATGKLGAGWNGYLNGKSLIFATILGQTVITATLISFSIPSMKAAAGNAKLMPLAVKMLRRHKKFPLIDSWGALLNSGSWQIPPLLFAAYFSKSFLGYYALAFRIIQLPMSVIGNSIGHVYYPSITELSKNHQSLKPLVYSLYKRLIQIGLFPSALLGVAGAPLFSLCFGSNWETAGTFSQILSPWFFVWFLAWPLSTVFNALERQGTLLVFNILIFTTRIGSILIGCYMQKPILSLSLYSLTGFLVYGFLCLYALHLSEIPFRTCLKTLLSNVVIVCVCLIPVIVTTLFYPLALPWIFSSTLLSALIYGLAVYKTDKDIQHFITHLILSKGFSSK